MNKLSQWISNLKTKLFELSTKKKIAYGIILVSIIGVLIYGVISVSSTKYAVLFQNVDSDDAGAIYTKLKEKKEDFKVEGNTILVPKDKVDSLRMEVLAEVPMTNGSQGFELLDKSKLGSTDAEMKINYQRALQGEIERTIKAFPEVENARVHLVLPEDSVFVKDSAPAKASITLKIKSGKKLTNDQVKAIVSLASGSVKNLPKENVEINDTKGSLTQNLFEDSKFEASSSAEKQQVLEKDYEKKLENKVTDMLSAVYGKDKVRVIVNADLNFDAQETDKTTYDPKNIVVSEKNSKTTEKGSQGEVTGSPVDDNMNNEIDTNADGSVTTHEENTKNYQISESKEKIIKAPGDVNRLTVSVILDGVMDNATRASVSNSVMSAVGYSQARGDSISVEGLAFDKESGNKIKDDLEAMEKEEERAALMKRYGLIGIGVILLLTLVIGIILRRRSRKKEEEEVLQLDHIDTIIDDEVELEQKPKFKPIELETETEISHTENEIRKYAMDKPDQVSEIIKSWLAEDER
ncbi:MAG: flagellar basal body M-ring protein FliF [Clostridium lundense]|nr:flagellar basal body M-ring protein FliF [Clostridium lundense]